MPHQRPTADSSDTADACPRPTRCRSLLRGRLLDTFNPTASAAIVRDAAADCVARDRTADATAFVVDEDAADCVRLAAVVRDKSRDHTTADRVSRKVDARSLWDALRPASGVPPPSSASTAGGGPFGFPPRVRGGKPNGRRVRRKPPPKFCVQNLRLPWPPFPLPAPKPQAHKAVHSVRFVATCLVAPRLLGPRCCSGGTRKRRAAAAAARPGRLVRPHAAGPRRHRPAGRTAESECTVPQTFTATGDGSSGAAIRRLLHCVRSHASAPREYAVGRVERTHTTQKRQSLLCTRFRRKKKKCGHPGRKSQSRRVRGRRLLAAVSVCLHGCSSGSQRIALGRSAGRLSPLIALGRSAARRTTWRIVGGQSAASRVRHRRSRPAGRP